MIIAASDNNLCKKNGAEIETQLLIRETMGKINNAALIVHSHCPASQQQQACSYSKNIGINATLRDLGLRKWLTFVDSYVHFSGRLNLSQGDRTHLRGGVKAEMVRMIEGTCSHALL